MHVDIRSQRDNPFTASQILGLWLKSFSVAIHVEATEQLFHVVLVTMLYNLVPILGAVD